MKARVLVSLVSAGLAPLIFAACKKATRPGKSLNVGLD
jgi:amino acid permease